MEDSEHAAYVMFQAYGKFVEWKCRPPRALVCAWLSEALLARGQRERALELADEGLALSEELGFALGGGLARRALGRIALAKGALVEAEGHLHGALEVFRSIPATLEEARTLRDLAEVADASGRSDAAATHLAAARRGFSDLKIPSYAAGTAKLTASPRGAAAQG